MAASDLIAELETAYRQQVTPARLKRWGPIAFLVLGLIAAMTQPYARFYAETVERHLETQGRAGWQIEQQAQAAQDKAKEDQRLAAVSAKKADVRELRKTLNEYSERYIDKATWSELSNAELTVANLLNDTDFQAKFISPEAIADSAACSPKQDEGDFGSRAANDMYVLRCALHIVQNDEDLDEPYSPRKTAILFALNRLYFSKANSADFKPIALKQYVLYYWFRRIDARLQYQQPVEAVPALSDNGVLSMKLIDDSLPEPLLRLVLADISVAERAELATEAYNVIGDYAYKAGALADACRELKLDDCLNSEL